MCVHYNQELYSNFKYVDITECIRSSSLTWTGHLIRITEAGKILITPINKKRTDYALRWFDKVNDDSRVFAREQIVGRICVVGFTQPFRGTKHRTLINRCDAAAQNDNYWNARRYADFRADRESHNVCPFLSATRSCLLIPLIFSMDLAGSLRLLLSSLAIFASLFSIKFFDPFSSASHDPPADFLSRRFTVAFLRYNVVA